jgi:hypothetical protein
MSLANLSTLNTFTEQMTRVNQMVVEMNRMLEGQYVTSGNVLVTGTSVSGDVLANVFGILKATTIVTGNGAITRPALAPAITANSGIYFPAANSLALVTASNSVIYLTPAGNVSVGASQANAKLEISGTFAVLNRSYFGSNVGIGITSPQRALDVSGDIWATGDIVMESDVSTKENITNIVNPIEIMKQMRGVSYTKKGSGRHQTGLIAQEVQKVLPFLVQDKNDGLGVNYIGVIAYLIEAVKDLSDKIDRLEKGDTNA